MTDYIDITPEPEEPGALVPNQAVCAPDRDVLDFFNEIYAKGMRTICFPMTTTDPRHHAPKQVAWLHWFGAPWGERMEKRLGEGRVLLKHEDGRVYYAFDLYALIRYLKVCDRKIYGLPALGCSAISKLPVGAHVAMTAGYPADRSLEAGR